MKSKFIGLLFLLTMFLPSCDTLGQVCIDQYSTPYTVIIRYGKPYYIGNTLSYIYYDNRYYYPYVINGHRHFKCYDRVQPRGFVYRHYPNDRYRAENMIRYRGNLMGRSSSRHGNHNVHVTIHRKR